MLDISLVKNLTKVLGFLPKENASDIYVKSYSGGHYSICIDIEKETIDYGDKIKSDCKTTQNFSQPENFVVLECVDRLLCKGYKPENIILEKTWAAGHGTSGRLDICVTRDDGSEYLLIECKTYGKEFDKAFARMKKDGGQLFTYFKFSNKPDIIMLYASELKGNGIVYCNEIVKIEDGYRTGDVKDFYEKWNKLTKDNGVFDEWVKPYNFESKAITRRNLKPITQNDSSFIFNTFLEILRHNVVSDKPNAFNKIFTLFLCKIYDEKTTKIDDELKFQWLEGKDDDITFQIRLTDLYKAGMREFLEKEVTDFSDDDFDTEYKHLDDVTKKSLRYKINKIRLEKNNEFAIKEVFDEKSFKENAKIVKEVVELLQGYRLRYNERQQYLSDFFESLLTTGLKQEAGQFFTPVPIAQFIIKSLPIDKFVDEKLDKGESNELLPYLIDYASGSGHFVTESMHEIQRLISKKNPDDYIESTAGKIRTWQNEHFDWATQYVYGVEKDYRLVKVGKVGCYLHGDGLANVILSDGLARFGHSEYKGKLNKRDSAFPKENKQFEIIVSNPPYSVSAFKNVARDYYTEKDYELYDNLTDNSSEIECLFVERTKQLLKDGGVAGVILPSSILSNEGIYTKAREIILSYFEIIAIAELGSNTFMATGTNTVVLFLRRRNNFVSINLRGNVDTFFTNFKDVVLNGVEKPVKKYVDHVWETITLSDYVSLLKNNPNEKVTEHEFYKRYRKSVKQKINAEIFKQNKNRKTPMDAADVQKITERVEKDCFDKLIETEKEKLLYFVLAYPQKVVVVRTGEKDAEKRFLGYRFSDSKGNAGIHSISGYASIEESTKLFDAQIFDNPEKASTYIYKAFLGDYETPIHDSLKDNIFRVPLINMLAFDKLEFAKSVSTVANKKVKIDTKWEQTNFSEVACVIRGVTYSKGDQQLDPTTNIVLTADNITLDGHLEIKKEVFLYEDFNVPAEKLLKKNDIFMCFSSGSKEHLGKVAFIDDDTNYMAGGFMGIIRTNDNILPKYLFQLLNSLLRQPIRDLGTGSNINNLSSVINDVKIPLPPKDVQKKIVAEIEALEKKETEAKDEIEKRKEQIEDICLQTYSKYNKEKLAQLATTNPSKTEITDLDGNTLISFVDMPSVSNGGYISNRIVRPYSEIKKGSYTYFREGDIIIAKITPCMENGKCAIATNLTNGLALGSSEFHVFRANNRKINTKYLFTLLNRKSIRIEAEKNMTGASGHRRVPITFYEKLEIPCPSLPEQQKIVTKIEKLESQIAESQKIIDDMPMQKSEVLRKYL